MRDRQNESLYHPRAFLSLDGLDQVLCVAPHPDDEVLGPGGLLALLAGLGRQVRCAILSRGEFAKGDVPEELAAVRMDESRQAARVLGLPEPRFLAWPDRGMRYGQALIDDIATLIDEAGAQVLLLPALSEPHPDHQAVALAGLAAAQRSTSVRTLLFYEVGAPMHPNALVDITSVAQRKWDAIAAFASQVVLQPYDVQARAMASLRAFGSGASSTAAEAFFQVEVDALRRDGPAAALPLWPLVRAQQQLANTTVELPLVSVLVRSMDRPQLAQALAAVAAQTWSNLELVVLNASGRPHSPLLARPAGMPVRLVQPGLDEGGAARACERAAAANLALQAARGDYALVLDDDDLIDPPPLERLVAALQAQPRAVAAYSGVRVLGAGGDFLRDYDLPWAPQRLAGINFLPIQAVLFRVAAVRAAALRFDETLPVLEDWDFWRRLAAQGPFVHCPGISAVYRQGHGDSGVGMPGHPNHWERWHRLVLERSLTTDSPQQVAEVLAWHAVQLDRAQSEVERMGVALDACSQKLRAATDSQAQAQAQAQAQQLDALQATLAGQRAALADAQARVHSLQAEHELVLRSRSWRLTRPLRALARALRAARSGK
jgi:LmbE family N-acetylglucosaminyl deacetylase